MNRLFIVISFCLCSFLSHAMEQPATPAEKITEISSQTELAVEMLLRTFKNKEFKEQPIQDLTVDILPYLLETCLTMPFTSYWIPEKHMVQFALGIYELQKFRTLSFNNITSNRMKEKAIDKANQHFTKAAKPFQKNCYIRNPHDNESYWQPRTMYFSSALYAQAYTAIALTEYNFAHDSLIKAIEIDHNYMIGGMSIELLMVLAFTLKYERSQQYFKEHNKLIAKLQQYMPIKAKMIEQTKTPGIAATNVLNKIKSNQEIIKDEDTEKTLRKLNKKLAPRGLSLLTTIQSPQGTIFVVDEPPKSSKPLTGKQKREAKRKAREETNKKK